MPSKREGQVIAYDVDSDGRYKQKYAYPETPVTMRTLPVGTRVVRNMFAIRYSVPAVTVLSFLHQFPLLHASHCRILS
jgi:hypothetical protein